MAMYDCNTYVAYSVNAREPRYAAVNGSRSRDRRDTSVVRGPRHMAPATIVSTEPMVIAAANLEGTSSTIGKNTKMATMYRKAAASSNKIAICMR